MNAEQAFAGRNYKTPDGKEVTIVEKRPGQVLVRLVSTGDMVVLPNSYNLNEVNNMPDSTPVIIVTPAEPVAEKKEEIIEKVEVTEAAAPAPKTTKKLKKSTIVDQGLLNKATTDSIVSDVLAKFPEATEKSIRNLVSVRRARLKKSQG